MKPHTRRTFLKRSIAGSAGLVALPTILPSSVFGFTAPNRRIQVAQIGCGRMGSEDMKGVLSHSMARVVAVCDLDSKRLDTAKQRVIDSYRRCATAGL